MRLFGAAVSLLAFSHFSIMAQTERTVVDLVLPTDNDALFSGDGPAFYQYVERNYSGVKSTPWEGGQYGFVRDPTDTAGGVVYIRFHEGIDIRPLHRDANGDPLDEVCAIADGKVVGVVQISRKGKNGPAAGPDFTIKDLTALMATAGILAKALKK